MKIAMIAPLALPVPPDSYGGTERVIYCLIEGLIKLGHDVTLFGAEGSKISGKVDTTFGGRITGLPLDRPNVYQVLKRIDHIISISGQFDIIHNHDGALPMCFASQFKCKLVTTTHTDLSRAVGDDKMKQLLFRENNIVSISDSQRKGFPEGKYVGTVYNGTVDLNEYKLGQGGDYLVWIGRFNPYKGAGEAIEVAKKANKKIILAGKVEEENLEYYKTEIEPKFNNQDVVYIGEVGLEKKIELFQNAEAMLMPISWEEPFGLVMIEAMACGTPVIAFNRGSVSEVVKEGVSGFVVAPGDIDSMVTSVGKLKQIDRGMCRQYMADNFSIEKMVEGYGKIYQQLL